MKMLVGRLVLAATAFLLVIGDTTSSQLREEVTTSKERLQSIDKDAITDHRQGRMALHTEPPANKAKREQALRHILAARRRQAFNSKSISAKTPKSIISIVKDPLDMLEAQETRHGVFVTVPMGDQLAEIVDDDDDDIRLSTAKNLKTNETTIIELNNTTVKKDANETKNLSITLTRNQKNPDEVLRKKNTVVMPDSLYNHFRPVESNIPVEDMTQFLYFGQKIHPDNVTSNNSAELVTSTTTTTTPIVLSLNSRRRFNNKRYTTTLSTVAKLDEIMNEEMDITVEKSTIDRNKILKNKNTFRTTGMYLRKLPPVRPSDPTIITNVILTNRNKNDSQLNSSAHASQLAAIADREMGSIQRANTTTESTHIPKHIHQRNESEIPKIHITSTTTYPEVTINDYQNDETLGRDKNNSPISRVTEATNEQTKLAYLNGKTSTEPATSSTESNDLRGLTRLSTWMSVEPATSSLKPSTEQSVTFNDLRQDIPTVTDNLHQHSSTLRIVVTEPMAEVSSSTNNYDTTTVTPANLLGQISNINMTNSTISLINNYSNNNDTLSISSTIHPYSYTITNVTRLLRNYSEIIGQSEKTTIATTLKIERTEGGKKMKKEREKNDNDEAGLLLLPPLSGPLPIEGTRAPAYASSDPTVVEEQRITNLVIHQQNTTTNDTINLLDYSISIDGIRWNNNTITKKIDNEKETIIDRRLTRKSASAVLNQRTSELNKDIKRRRVDSGGRRIKTTINNEQERYNNNKTINDHDLKILHEKIVNIDDVMGKQAEDQQTTLSPITILDLPPKILTDLPNDNNQTIDNNNGKSNITKISSASEYISTLLDITTIQPTTLELPSTLRSLGTTTTTQKIQPPLTTTSTTTTKPPAFPVTPVILDDLRHKATNDNEELPMELDIEKNSDKPFGIAKELDPSEIQKMYRAQTTTLHSETLITTTVIVDQSSESELTTIKPIERSPSVRARNLSDKAKDNDDILPIMELYNNSNILNDTIKTTIETKLTHTTDPSTTLKPTTTEEALTIQTTSTNDNKVNLTRTNNKNNQEINRDVQEKLLNSTNKPRQRPIFYNPGQPEYSGYHPELNNSYLEPGMIALGPREPFNVNEVITRRHDGDLATQETVAIVSYILATLVVFPIAVGVGLILRRLIIRNRKVLEESDTSSEISCRKDALNLENGDFKTSIEKAITKLPRIQHLVSQNELKKNCHEAEKPPPPVLSQEHRWEFPRDKIRLQTVLGQGNFGQVWKAEADDLTGHQGTTRLVAVKTVKEGASAREKEDLVRELEIMQQLGNHPNVVTLLGCCTEEEPHYLILEYVMYGKLLTYLRDHRTRQNFYNFSEDSAALTSRDLTVFGYCVARGMEYLASKKIIHRDLAARNVLVDHNKLCKIADFGMSRFANDDGECIETRHGRNALPIRWMAPESLIYSLFTVKTDVWSFGILMWEIVTLGSTPYPDMAAREVMRNVQNGYRLERPSHCRSELFRVIARCWHADPERRPDFPMLRRDLAQLLEDNMNGHYVDLESFASECQDDN